MGTGEVLDLEGQICLGRAGAGGRVVVEVSAEKPPLTVDRKLESLRTMMDTGWRGRGSPCQLLGGGHRVRGGESLKGPCWGSRCGTGPARRQWNWSLRGGRRATPHRRRSLLVDWSQPRSSQDISARKRGTRSGAPLLVLARLFWDSRMGSPGVQSICQGLPESEYTRGC